MSESDKLVYEIVKESYIDLYGDYTEEELLMTFDRVNKIIKTKVTEYANEQAKTICENHKKDFYCTIGR